jgi:uncharacterized protein
MPMIPTGLIPLWAIFILAIALAPLPGQDAAWGQSAFPPLLPTLTTTGTASIEVVPDIVTITAGIETERPKAADAARDNAQAAQAVIAEIKAQGIGASDIRTVSVTLEPVYDEVLDQSGRVTKKTLRGYIARNIVSVRVRVIAKAGALAGQLIDKGASSIDSITFDYSQREAQYDVLRGNAVRDALRKANSYVNGLGLRLGRVLAIEAEPAEPLAAGRAPRMAAPSSQGGAAAPIPVEPGAETLRADVRVTWEIAQ